MSEHYYCSKNKKPKKKAKYNGTHCPYCGGMNIVAMEQVQMDGEFGTQLIECKDCGKGWYDVLKLTGWEALV